MKLANYIIDFLVSNGVRHVFEVCGGSIMHLLDSLYGRKDISTISMHHEQAAAFAAEGYSRSGTNIGVAMATSGPGATNLITGIASCFFDSIPCLFITGQVNTYEFKFEKTVRQIGFQETDIVNIVKPIVKDSMLVTDPDEIRYCLQRAMFIAKNGRPGPVLIDIPMNVQRAQINPKLLKGFHGAADQPIAGRVNGKTISRIVELINSSKRPVALVGGGLRLAGACDEFYEFIRNVEIPVVVSLMGIDAFPHDNPLFLGMIGTYGNRYANFTIASSDLLLVIGARLDTRQTGTKPETFARGAKIVHVDIDSNELNNKIKADFPVNCDIKLFLTTLNKKLKVYDKNKIQPWREKAWSYKKRYSIYNNLSGNFINPNHFMEELSGFLPERAIICADVGQNQIWSAQSLQVRGSQRFLTQGGAGAMGSALSIAIGAWFANPDKTVIVITGDGGIQLNIQELQTICHHKIPLKIVLLNNGCYGMVRQFQEQYFKSRFQSTLIGYSCPDFQSVVRAYKIPTNKISKKKEISRALRNLFGCGHASFLEVIIDHKAKVTPKLAVGKPIEDQEPVLPRKELKSNMLIDIVG